MVSLLSFTKKRSKYYGFIPSLSSPDDMARVAGEDPSHATRGKTFSSSAG
jgi:hypothetical protein